MVEPFFIRPMQKQNLKLRKGNRQDLTPLLCKGNRQDLTPLLKATVKT
jgi:hypothetical protein